MIKKMNGPKTISLVTPCFNEESVLPIFFEEVDAFAKTMEGYKFEFVFVDDGSTDNTLALLLEFAARDMRVRVIELSRNFGKEPALSAGLDYAGGDAVVPIDADMQDPPELIGDMIRQWEKGAQMVLARRTDRMNDTFLKRETAHAFYRIHNAMSGVKLPENTGDFRLMDRTVVDAVKRLPERARFMKGMFAWVGFRTVEIEYARRPRAAGHTKFSGFRLWNFALEGITSFTAAPLKTWTYVGLAGAFFGSVYAIVIFIRTLLLGIDVPGYTSTLLVVLFFGSTNLISIGLLGEYVSRIYIEVKRRPLYIVNGIHCGDRKNGS